MARGNLTSLSFSEDMEGNLSEFSPTSVGFAHSNATGPCFEWFAEKHISVNMTFKTVRLICGKSNWLDFHGRLTLTIVLSVINILLNGIVIFGIVKGQLRRPLYYLIGNLAVIDIITGVVSHVMIELTDVVTYQRYVLLLVTVLHFPVILSLTGLVLLSLDRYISVQHAIYHSTVSGGYVFAMIAGAWAFAALLCFSPMMGWNCDVMSTDDDMCFLGAVESSYILFMTVLCVAGVGVVVVANARVYVVLRRRLAVAMDQDQQPNGRVHIHRQQITAAQSKAKSVLVIIGVFLVSWLPFLSWQLTLIISIHNSWDVLTGIDQQFRGVFLIVMYLVPIVNPFVYAFRLPKLRRVIWNSFRSGGVRLWRCFAPPQQVHPEDMEMSVIAT